MEKKTPTPRRELSNAEYSRMACAIHMDNWLRDVALWYDTMNWRKHDMALANAIGWASRD
jgi:hypothetical protein